MDKETLLLKLRDIRELIDEDKEDACNDLDELLEDLEENSADEY